ncbi:type II toxin-antitoxin system VapC family toxin [Atopobiaceae bacterium SGI.236]
MDVVVDSNVLIDYLKERDGFALARKLLVFSEMGDYGLWMSASQATDLFYIMTSGGRKTLSAQVRDMIRCLRKSVGVLPITQREVDLALDSGWEDFEDSVLHQAAVNNGASAIVTRDARGFVRSAIPVLDPEEFFEWMERKNGIAYEEITF